jgi:hypothetical protein
MGRNPKALQPVKSYVEQAKPLLTSSESATSHVLVCLLTTLQRIKPYDLFPQVRGTRGIIDFIYMPKGIKDVNFFIELKKYGSLKGDHAGQKNKYLKGKLPQPLGKFGRKDGWRVLILTDLRHTEILVRKTEKRGKKRAYRYPLPPGDVFEVAGQIKEWLVMERGTLCRTVLWEQNTNRFDIVLRDLKKRANLTLGKLAYQLWLNTLRMKGGKGKPKRFKDAFRAAYVKDLPRVPPDDINAVKQVFEEHKVQELIRKLFKGYGVKFKKNFRCSLN